MIVRNEMDRYLPLALDHLTSFCDEVRVLDDHSDDGTFELLHGMAPKVQVARTHTRFFEHEGNARNELLQWTLHGQPTYVLSIDADEFVGDPDLVRRAMNAGGAVYTLQMEEVWRLNEVMLHIRTDGQWGPRRCPILWKAPPERQARHSGQWKVPNIQLACGREPLAVRRTRGAISGSSVLHFGWANQAQRKRRAERYFEHDQGRFHKDAHLQSILWPDERVRTQTKEWPKGMSAELREKISERANR